MAPPRATRDPARFTVGLALEHPDHAPSKAQLRAALPIDNEQIAEARREIAAKRLAYVDRPTDKSPGTQRFNRAVRLKNFAPLVDHRRTGGRYTIVPTAITSRLKGRGGLAACRLLTLYQREQMQRGAIQMPDSVAAWLLGWAMDKAKRVRQRLQRVGLLEQAARPTSHYPAVYVIPEAHPSAPPKPLELNPERTRFLQRVELSNEPTLVYASAGERALLEARAAQAPPGLLREVLGSEPIVASQALDILGGGIPDRSGTDTGQVTGGQRTETTPPLHPFTSSLEPEAKRPAKRDEDGEQSLRRRQQPRRYEWGPSYANVYYHASRPVHRQIVRFVRTLRDAYGIEEARGHLRTACLGSGSKGTDVLAWLRSRFPDRDPERMDTALVDVLADFAGRRAADV